MVSYFYTIYYRPCHRLFILIVEIVAEHLSILSTKVYMNKYFKSCILKQHLTDLTIQVVEERCSRGTHRVSNENSVHQHQNI